MNQFYGFLSEDNRGLLNMYGVNLIERIQRQENTHCDVGYFDDCLRRKHIDEGKECRENRVIAKPTDRQLFYELNSLLGFTINGIAFASLLGR